MFKVLKKRINKSCSGGFILRLGHFLTGSAIALIATLSKSLQQNSFQRIQKNRNKLITADENYMKIKRSVISRPIINFSFPMDNSAIFYTTHPLGSKQTII